MKRTCHRLLSVILACSIFVGGFLLVSDDSEKISAAAPPLTVTGINSSIGGHTLTGTYNSDNYRITSYVNGHAFYTSPDGGSYVYYDSGFGCWVFKNQYWWYYYSTTVSAVYAPTTGWLMSNDRSYPNSGGGTVDPDFKIVAGPTYTFATSGISVSEPTNGSGDQLLAIPVSISSNVDFSYCSYTVTAGSATAGVDYIGSSGQLALNGGTTNTNIYVSLVDDGFVEPSETFTVRLTGGSGVFVGLDTYTVTITNNDVLPTVGFTSSTGSVSEGSSAGVTVSLNKEAAAAVTVRLNTANITAVAGSDYTAIANQTVTIPAGSTSVFVPITVTDDSLYEGDETLSVSLSSAIGATLGVSSQTLTISDSDDFPTIGFSSATSAISEDNASPKLTVALSNPSLTAVTALLTTANVSAIAGDDYTAISSQLVTIPAGETSVDIPLQIVNDAIYEGNETLTATLTSPTGGTLGVSSQTVTLTDDETMPEVSLQAASVLVNENEGEWNLVLTLDKASSQTTTVFYSFTDGSATFGTDYDSATQTGTVTFAPGETLKAVHFDVNDDLVYEGNETATFLLSSPSGAILGTIHSSSITLVENEPIPTFNLDPGSVSINEDAGTMTFTVNLSGAAAATTSVQYETVAGTAAGDGDYGTTSGTLTFAPGELSHTFTVAIAQDAIDEQDETFQVSIGSPANAGLGATFSKTVTIVDDDATPTVSLTSHSLSVGEEDGNVVITAVLSGESSTPIVYYYSMSGTSAKNGSDYSLSSGTLTFAPGVTSASVTIPIMNDMVYENTEDFVFLLHTNPALLAGESALDSAAITILDDEAIPLLEISPVSPVTEGTDDQIPVVFTLSGLSDADVIVDYAITDNTALSGSDFTAASGQITIPAGELSATLQIPVINDTTCEPSENFTISILNASVVMIGADFSQAIAIYDDDASPILSLSADSFTVLESSLGIDIKLVLSNPSSQDISVLVETKDKTALSGTDYTAFSQTITIPAGSVSATVRIPITNDSLVESDVVFSINAHIVNAGTVVVASKDVTITSDDLAPTPTPTATPVSDTGVLSAQKGTSAAVTKTGETGMQMEYLFLIPLGISTLFFGFFIAERRKRRKRI